MVGREPKDTLPNFCSESLGLEDRSGGLPDAAFTASSSYDSASVGPQNGRLHFDSSGGAWCPSQTVSKETVQEEFIEVDLGSMFVITETMTQGRFGKGRGQEYAEAYTIQYWRPGMMDFKDYRDNMGRAILPGNANTYSVSNNTLNPAIIASKIRFLPYSDHPRTVCMRVGLSGCPFREGVTAYSIPQGMIRGSMLELMDHTFDGHEDSLTGDLRGGLGQLVDGKYGRGNFKAAGMNGQGKGYAWLGWKRRPSGYVNLVFTFDHIRTFSRVDIHANNHFTKDIQVFNQAKIYFSNEEDKFGDDRFVDFSYMPDLALENARNVSINLKGEHGQYVMIQLYFEAKWIMISEVTFVSKLYSDQKALFPPNSITVNQNSIHHRNTPVEDLVLTPPDHHSPIYDDEDFREVPGSERPKVNIDISSPSDKKTTPDIYIQSETDSNVVGIVIGLLLTVILLLCGGILIVVYRGKRAQKSTPTYSLLTRKFNFVSHETNNKAMGGGNDAFPHHVYTPYSTSTTAKTTLYCGRQNSNGSNDRAYQTQETIYEEPMNSNQMYTSTTGGFLSLNRKFNSDPVLSEDCPTDEYAEPQNIISANSFNENIYAQAISPSSSSLSPLDHMTTSNNSNSNANINRPVILQPLPITHYARPMSPPTISSPISAKVSPPKYSSVVPPSMRMKPPSFSALMTSTPSSSTVTPVRSPMVPILVPDFTSTLEPSTTTSRSSSNSTAVGTVPMDINDNGYYASVDVSIPDAVELAKLYAQIDRTNDTYLPRQPVRSVSIDTVTVKLNEVPRSRLYPLEKLGEGQFGEIHLCQLEDENGHDKIVAVKSLKADSNESARSDFEQEARILTSLDDVNLVSIIGVCFEGEPYSMVCEYTDIGDLNQFLQDHIAETSLSKSPGVPTLSYGSLIYIAAQIASGMKYLENLNFVHRDLATRNCLVGPNKLVKISDFGMSRELYRNDYFKSQAGCLLPIRWMAWESVLMGKFSTKSDVWSFGVTLWEILTFARSQPFETLTDEKVIGNLSHLYRNDRPNVILPVPRGCPKAVWELMRECWNKEDKERPSFREIHLFLQRMNLGYSPDKAEA
ncbi:discoidin domain-containing receptor 2-like isoform X2 [Tigriopus californicus]|uniref:discoidin domain-containing receptor 2-like isoform X2 n=1 Tax=Tigriopus californicus TaxID=6832 RepID=UPI0027DA1A1E|nr:discoidin domain-containing receptor 2-like isoform X2 [Tigriopus californicus]